MTFFSSKYLAVFTVLTGCSLLLGCNKKADEQQIANSLTFQCIENQSECLIAIDVGEFNVAFSEHKLLAERPFYIQVSANTADRIISLNGFIEGKAMFMGKIPVFFDQPSASKQAALQSENGSGAGFPRQSLYTAETLVAACVEEQMRWVLWLTVITEAQNGEQVKRSFPIEFDAFRD